MLLDEQIRRKHNRISLHIHAPFFGILLWMTKTNNTVEVSKKNTNAQQYTWRLKAIDFTWQSTPTSPGYAEAVINGSYVFIIIFTAVHALSDAEANNDGEDNAESSANTKADPLQLMEEKFRAADLVAQPAEGVLACCQIGCHVIEETSSRLGTELLADFTLCQIITWTYLK